MSRKIYHQYHITKKYPTTTYEGQKCVKCGSTTRYKPKANKKTGGCVACARKYRIEHGGHGARDPQYQRNYELQRCYGITQEDFLNLLSGQNSICPICKFNLNPSVKGINRVCVDHDHDSGIVRGLLHGRCNQALGLLYDSPDTCRNAASYLDGQLNT